MRLELRISVERSGQSLRTPARDLVRALAAAEPDEKTAWSQSWSRRSAAGSGWRRPACCWRLRVRRRPFSALPGGFPKARAAARRGGASSRS